MNDLSQGNLEQESDSSEAEEKGSTPTGDTDDSSGALQRDGGGCRRCSYAVHGCDLLRRNEYLTLGGCCVKNDLLWT